MKLPVGQCLAQAQPPHGGGGSGKDTDAQHAIVARTGHGAAGEDAEQDGRGDATVHFVQAIAHGDKAVAGFSGLDLSLAGRTAQRLGALTFVLGNPAQHAVLVGLEGAGAGVDPGSVGGLGGVL